MPGRRISPLLVVAAAASCGGATAAGSAGPVDGSVDAVADGHALADSGATDAPPHSDVTAPSDGSAGGEGGPVDAGGDAPSVDAGDFFSALPGIWLVGWSGGLNHYSWVRFDAGGASADYLPGGAEILSNAPYWSCSGQGTYTITQKPNTVMLMFPAACNLAPLVLTFDSFYTAGIPPKATLGAHVSTDPPNQPLDGFKYPASQCDAAMTTCTSPF